MKEEGELSDKEWRQMRRQMSKLDFEPVPETPALLPRSLYGENEEDLTSTRDEQEEKSDSSLRPNHHSSPKTRSETMICDNSLDESEQTLSEKTVKANGELPSTSMAVSPLITRCYRPSEHNRPPENKCELNDAEIAAIDAQMAVAQETTRRSIMRAFIDLKAKKARSEALERMKLSAAHTSDVKILQDNVEKLKEQVAHAEAQRDQRDLLLDRFSEFTAKQSRLNEGRWSGNFSLVECFHTWNGIVQQTAAKRSALHRILIQSCKRQQLASFRRWTESARGFLFQKQLQDQRDRYENRMAEMSKEYQLKIQQRLIRYTRQLQQELESANSQVVESQRCRQKLEEDLRLIFLRGVSAMNIEALTVFGSSHKQNRKLDEQERLMLPSRHQEVTSNQTAECEKTNPTSSSGLITPEALPPPKESTPSTSPEACVPVPVAVEVSTSACSMPSHSRISVVPPSCSQAPQYLNRVTNGWSHLSSTPGLRSAEMIRQHELSPTVQNHPASRSTSSLYRPSSAPSPTKKRSSSQMNAKYQVEMQYMRSTVAASAARAACTRPASTTRSPLSSARSRRS